MPNLTATITIPVIATNIDVGNESNPTFETVNTLNGDNVTTINGTDYPISATDGVSIVSIYQSSNHTGVQDCAIGTTTNNSFGLFVNDGGDALHIFPATENIVIKDSAAQPSDHGERLQVIGTLYVKDLSTVEKLGTGKANTDLLALTNTRNVADMDGTGTGIVFNQYYYDATTPGKVAAGRIKVVTETDWTSTAATQDAKMVLQTSLDGVMTDQVTIGSNGNVAVAGSVSTPSGTAALNASSATSGGVSTPALTMGTSGLVGVYFGAGAPTISAGKGSLYLRTDGSGVADRAYINTNGSTTWTALATAG